MGWHPDWEALLRDYGYLAVWIGTFLEGESILVMGGVAAHQGYLRLPLVVLAAFCGSFMGDQLFFHIGRTQGMRFLQGRPRWQARFAQVHLLLERFHTIFILGFRFLYGLRSVSPFVLGTSKVSRQRFFVLNMIGALVWAASIGSAGYAFGGALELMPPWLRKLGLGLGVAVAAGVLGWGWWRLRRPPVAP